MENQLCSYTPNLLTSSELAAQTTYKLNLDSTAALFFENEVTATLPTVFANLYQKRQISQFITFKSSAVPGQRFVEYYKSDSAGTPIFVSDNSTQMSYVDLTRSKKTYELFQTKIDISFTKDELDKARLAGVSLIQDKYAAAIQAHAQQTENFGWFGNSAPKLQGWLKHPDVPASVVATGASGQTTWKDKTAQEIVYDIGQAIQEFILQAGGNHTPDTLVVSLQNYSYLNSTFLPGSQMYTLLQFIRNNFQNLNIDWAFSTDKGFVGNSDGFILFEKNPTNFWYENGEPMWAPLRDKEFTNFDQRTALYLTHGGVIITRPNSQLFKYGI
jgi:hypothetical protein